jgi:hypothetical protein
MLNKSERAIINRESTDTGNIRLKTKNEDKRNKKNNTENLWRSNTHPTKHWVNSFTTYYRVCN